MTNLENQIAQQIKSELSKIISNVLAGYNSPLNKLITDVFEKEREEVTEILKSVFAEVVKTNDFKEALKEEFHRKVAKELIANLTGQVARAANELKRTPTMKARMILAIEDIINQAD